MRVVIAPDKFKGTLSASGAAQAIASGWSLARPEDRLDLLPITDGGDGFGAVMGDLLGCRPQKVQTIDAAHRPCTATWFWHPRTRTAIIESATVIGLAMVPDEIFHPFGLDTFGLGAVIAAAAAKDVRWCVIGIGGSATNDGGFGLARSLGWRFLGADGLEIKEWTGLDTLAQILAPRRRRWFSELLVAMDVRNPLLGPQGATRIYGPQKRLRLEDVEPAEACLERLARIMKHQFGRNFSREPGAGAAGGLGFGLMAFLDAEPVGGFDLFAEFSLLDERLQAADCVITGEGTIDASTLMGKGTSQIAERCRKFGIPCIALAGSVDLPRRDCKCFTAAHALTNLTTVERAKANPSLWLNRLARYCGMNVSKTPSVWRKLLP